MNHVMIDFETLGNGLDDAIYQVGYVVKALNKVRVSED
jgi:hypothetical protein